MSLLRDFVGSFASNVGAQMYQREEEERRLKLEDEVARRRFARQHNMEAKVALDSPIPVGAPVQRGPGNWEQPTRMPVRALLDENTGEVVRPAAWSDGPALPTTDPNALSPKDAARLALDREKMEAANANAAARTAALRARGSGGSRAEVGEDGLTAYQREQLKRTDAREERLSKQSGKGGERPDNVRKLWDEEIMLVSDLDGPALRSKAKQYGVTAPRTDGVGAQPPVDDETLRMALLEKIDSKYASRLESAGKQGQESQANPGQAAAVKEAQAAIARGAPKEAVLKRLRELFPEASI